VRRPMDDDAPIDSLMDRTCDDESESVEAELWRRMDEPEHVWRCICCAGGSQIRMNRGCDMCELETLR